MAASGTETQTALAGILAQCGLESIAASNFSEVRAMFGTQPPPQLVFCEDDLPPGGFREVLRLARVTGSGALVVVTSLLGELDNYLEAMELGAFDFIAPPYRRIEVESIIKNGCENYFSRNVEGTPPNTQTRAVSRDKEAVA
ncbi:MAG: hypothetical protein ACRD20_08365 [Terriglobales bacterium]